MTGIPLPTDVMLLLHTLEANGFEAWIVGGCVRDTLLQKTPKDWDITTNAAPEQVKACFANYPVLETGLRHGTVTVLVHKKPYEITTYRVDGTYLNHRKPSQVYYTTDLKEDLSRRDFTINAMAYHPEYGLVDYFNGQDDLQHRIIRCVGDAERRFEEDALRILRALRFCAVLGFSLDPITEQALLQKRSLLSWISPERKREELLQLLNGDFVFHILTNFSSVLNDVIPGLAELDGFDQHNPHHDSTILVHTAKAVTAAPKSTVIRLTMLLHDIGKPRCFSIDEQGIGHFYGHAHQSEQMANQILSALRFDHATLENVCTLIRYHDTPIEATPKSIRRWLNRLGKDCFFSLLQVKTADTLALAPAYHERVHAIRELKALANAVLEENSCFSIAQLSVNGSDLIRLGIPEGKQIGQILSCLLHAVIEEECPNEPKALLEYVTQHFLSET